MPYKVKKANGYQVSSPHGTKAKNTTKAKAEGQVRLLRGIEHGWEPTGQPSKLAKVIVNKSKNKLKGKLR